MPRMAFSVAFLVLTALAAGGCATKALVENAGEEEFSDNVAAYATNAWRGGDGDLVVCVTGWTAERRREGEPEPFSFRVTLGPPDTAAPDPGLDEPAAKDPWELVHYPVAQESIEDSCPDRPDNALEVPVERIATGQAGEWADAQQPPMGLPAPVDPDRAGPVLYSFDHPGETGLAILVYRRETPLPEGPRLVRIGLPTETLYPNRMTILALPLALAVDVVGIVLIGAFCLLAGGNCGM